MICPVHNMTLTWAVVAACVIGSVLMALEMRRMDQAEAERDQIRRELARKRKTYGLSAEGWDRLVDGCRLVTKPAIRWADQGDGTAWWLPDPGRTVVVMNETHREVAKGMLLATTLAALCALAALGIEVWFS